MKCVVRRIRGKWSTPCGSDGYSKEDHALDRFYRMIDEGDNQLQIYPVWGYLHFTRSQVGIIYVALRGSTVSSLGDSSKQQPLWVPFSRKPFTVLWHCFVYTIRQQYNVLRVYCALPLIVESFSSICCYVVVEVKRTSIFWLGSHRPHRSTD